MAVFHQSDLSAWSRCPHAYSLSKSGQPRKQTSAIAYGVVMHHALEAFERLRHTGATFQQAVEHAVQTFDHYWHPSNIEAVTERVDLWLPKQGYNDMRQRGMTAIRMYADLIRLDDHELLATEYGFQVPIEGTWDDDLEEPHYLAGTIDRLAVRYYSGVLTVCVDDYKSGKEQTYLRQNLQFSAYCYATTCQEFWVGWRGEEGFGALRGMELHTRFEKAPRRGTWINMRTVKFQDAGWRGPKDFSRFALAIEQIHASQQADIFPLTINGEVCQYCEFRDICAGVGVPDQKHGAPTKESNAR